MKTDWFSSRRIAAPLVDPVDDDFEKSEGKTQNKHIGQIHQRIPLSLRPSPLLSLFSEGLLSHRVQNLKKEERNCHHHRHHHLATTKSNQQQRVFIMSSTPATKPKKILMTVVAARGHAAPIMSLAAELTRRGHNVTLVHPYFRGIFSPTDGLWEADAHPQVNFEMVAPCNGADCTAEAERAWWSEVEATFLKMGTMNGVAAILEVSKIVANVYGPMYEKCAELLENGKVKNEPFDLVLSDYISVAGVDAAWQYDTPLVINWPGLRLPFHSASFATHLVLPFAVPMRNPITRFLNHAFFVALTYMFMEKIEGSLKPHRMRLLKCKKPVPLLANMKSHPKLFNTVIGVSELAQYTCPLEHFVGPLLPKAAANLKQEEEQLSGDLATWLEQTVPANKPVILINFGTTGYIQEDKWTGILNALASMSEKTRPYVVWRMAVTQQKELNVDVSQLPEYIKMTPWIEPTQRACLMHPKIAVFVTHGGINSPQEAVECGKPCIIIPAFCDQMGHAARLEAAGIAVNLGRESFTSAGMKHALETVLGNADAYQVRVKKARSLMQQSGGTSKAVDIVEQVLENGYDHWTPGDMLLGYWQEVWRIDIVIGYLLLAMLLVWPVLTVVNAIGSLSQEQQEL